jgi:hypothetical protein
VSLSFDGVDDIVSRGNATLGNLLTVSVWVKLISFGENQSGAVWQQGGTADTSRSNFRVLDNKLNVAAKGFGFGSGRATTNGIWSSDDNVVALGVWQCLGVTYDATLTANNPQLYVNGAPATTTRNTGPSGASVDGGPVYIGNANALTRTFNGLIGEVGLWTRLLSPEEMAAVCRLGVFAVPDFFEYLPFDGGREQLFGPGGGVYTVSGPLPDENPPVRCVGRMG